VIQPAVLLVDQLQDGVFGLLQLVQVQGQEVQEEVVRGDEVATLAVHDEYGVCETGSEDQSELVATERGSKRIGEVAPTRRGLVSRIHR
jgi:hypothetical protein